MFLVFPGVLYPAALDLDRLLPASLAWVVDFRVAEVQPADFQAVVP